MLTKLRIRNFKQFEDVEIELGQTVVFIGPNNSGKTTALQALVLWYEGLQNWLSYHLRHPNEIMPVALNRLGIPSISVPTTRMLWRNMRVENGQSVRMSIGVSGLLSGSNWSSEFTFIFGSDEALSYVPTVGVGKSIEAPTIDELQHIRVLFLPTMSGLTATEPLLQTGRINVLISEGRTSEVLRNLCLILYESNSKGGNWNQLTLQIRVQFGIDHLPPEYLPSRGEIRMSYKDRNGITLDLSAAGRGMLQVLLLLAYMYNNPGAVLLLDEPDSHLEILRQREIYTLLNEVGQATGSQLIIATHSEVILDEAAGRRDKIIGFIGDPHPIRKISEFRKSLDLIRTDEYYLAAQTGWVLYVEGTTDFPILQAFATHLQHEAQDYLQLAFAKDIEGNEPSIVREHFAGLREAYPSLEAVAVFDRISEGKLQNIPPGLQIMSWRNREIENYLFSPEVLIAYAQANGNATETMNEVIQDIIPPIVLRNPADSWWVETKVSDDQVMGRVFREYAQRTGTPLLRKANYFTLVQYLPIEQINPEVTEKLDAILAVAKRAQPRED